MDDELCDCLSLGGRRARRERSVAGYLVRRLGHVVVKLTSSVQREDISAQAYQTRDYLLDAWRDDESVIQFCSPAGAKVSLFVLKEPDEDSDDENEEVQAVLEDVTLCLSLDAQVMLFFDDVDVIPYEKLDSIEAEIIAPKVLRILAFNRK